MFLLEAAKFIYKTKNCILPLQTIATHFCRTSLMPHRHFTRNRYVNSIVAPLHLMSSYAQKSIQLKADVLWANIPNEIKQAESFNMSKYSFKRHLISSG